jgi:hypothetical protein
VIPSHIPGDVLENGGGHGKAPIRHNAESCHTFKLIRSRSGLQTAKDLFLQPVRSCAA